MSLGNNIDLTNSYYLASTGNSNFIVRISPTCAPNDEEPRNIEMSSAKLSLPDNTDASKTNVMVIEVGVATNRPMVFTFSDIDAQNFHGGIYGSLAVVGTMAEELHYFNVYHK